MTIENYSTQGLKNLLDELENMATCVIGMPKDRISESTWNEILESQFELIKESQAYASMLLIDKG